MSWYVLYTAARAEKQVAARIEAEGVEKGGVEAYLPLHRRRKKWSDRIKVVEEPLFRSYVFVKCEEHILYNLRQIPGVANFIWYNKRPARVRDEEIEAIKEFLVYARQIVRQYKLAEEKYIEKKESKKQFSVSTQHYTFAIKAFIA